MNKYRADVLLELKDNGKKTQREISKDLNLSLGIVNQSMNYLKSNGYLTGDEISEKAQQVLSENRPQNAIILAAGLGLGMTPINRDCSKGMLVLHGRTIVENLICQLHDKGIQEIIIVVGFMKEQYEELIDKYNVKLIVNPKYHETNNIYSLYLAKEYIHHTYLLPCDVYSTENIFSENELYSWYLFDSKKTSLSKYRHNRSGVTKEMKGELKGNAPLSIAYVNDKDSLLLKEALETIDPVFFYKKAFYWEDVLFKLNTDIYAKMTKERCYEINSYDDLREVDPHSKNLDSEIIDIIKNVLRVNKEDISGFELTKKGMTNRSFTFNVKEEKYIMRIPGEGTEHLICREDEGNVYQALSKYDFSDEVLYFNSVNGYKLTRFLKNSRVCDPNSEKDLEICMNLLKEFHEQNLQVDHTFDLYEKIEYYESLRNKPSLYKDYDLVKKQVYELKELIDKCPKNWTLTHIDAVFDNFLLYVEDSTLKVRLIDWEYAAMQDSDVDLAMFCIYAMYNRQQIDHLIDIYYQDKSCSQERRIKIYAYISICGFLWSNWCEYKHALGIEFGEYSLAQYRYAKEYYEIVRQERKKVEGNQDGKI